MIAVNDMMHPASLLTVVCTATAFRPIVPQVFENPTAPPQPISVADVQPDGSNKACDCFVQSSVPRNQQKQRLASISQFIIRFKSSATSKRPPQKWRLTLQKSIWHYYYCRRQTRFVFKPGQLAKVVNIKGPKCTRSDCHAEKSSLIIQD